MSKKENAIFWDTAATYLDHQLKEIRQVSPNTVESYRSCLNSFIDYLESEVHIDRSKITFNHFDQKVLKEYQAWMVAEKKLSPKTCNLRMTAIRGLLEYAAQEHIWIMPLYTGACSINNVKTQNHPIEYFEPDEMAALLAAPSGNGEKERRNRMVLIFLYDTAARVAEAIHVRVCDLHLDVKVPYVLLFGKGRKYRNIPLSARTVQHLKQYIQSFHSGNAKSDSPLFYSKRHGRIEALSSDTFEKMIKKYADVCRKHGKIMPTNVHCHMIRKTRAMDMYQKGIPLTHIQQLLGHENISTTSGFYAFATLDVLANAMQTTMPDKEEKSWHAPEAMERLYKL